MDIYLASDVDMAVEIFTEKLMLILDELTPIRKIQLRANYAPFLTQTTLELMKRRDIAQQRAAGTKLQSDWDLYMELRNSVYSRIKEDKSNWKEEKLRLLGSNSSNVWKNIKQWYGLNAHRPPTQLMDEGVLFSKTADEARIMNTHFISKINNYVANLSEPSRCPMEPVRQIMRNKTCVMNFNAVHPDTVEKIIAGMKSSSSSGLDWTT